jgi:hypothetical protein
MAVTLNKFVVTATVQIAAGTVATVVAGEPGTGGAAGYGNMSTSAGAEDWPTTITAGTVIVLDNGTPSAMYTALNGAGVLRAFVPGQDDVGHAALSN